MKYWVNIDDIDHGPYTKMEIMNYVNEGSISMDDSICVVGDTKWSRIEDFFPRLDGLPPPKPPPKPSVNPPSVPSFMPPISPPCSREIKSVGTWDEIKRRL